MIEPAAAFLAAFVAAQGRCQNVDAAAPRVPGPPACALLLPDDKRWAYVRFRAPLAGRTGMTELVFLEECEDGLARVVADASGKVFEAVLVKRGPCTVRRDGSGCPDTEPLGDLRTRKQLENAAIAARDLRP